MVPAGSTVGLPDPDAGRLLGRSERSDDDIARTVIEQHRKSLDARRHLDLTKEMLMMHVDGGGSSQYASIYKGERIELPVTTGSMARVQENLLRPIVANAIAHHTTMQFRFTVEAAPDRKSQETAKIDAIFANYFARQQRLNRVFAEALGLAMCWGFCPVHGFWRDDPNGDLYEPLYLTGDDAQGLYLPRKGVIDAFVGDPADTVYNRGAKRDSVHWTSYARTLPAELVSDHFGVELRGSKRSFGSMWHRKASRWMSNGIVLGAHGTNTITEGYESDEELIAVVCREWAPGILKTHPEGRLVIIALDGAASSNPMDNQGHGRPVLLLDGPLPGKRFSQVRVYSDTRQDDVHGKPWVEDLDEIQVDLNQYLSKRKERIRRSTNALLVTSGRLNDDSSVYEDDAELEIDPAANFQPYYLQMPTIPELDISIAECRQALFTIGGYQAASRGESRSGQAAAAVVALQAADNTIHGPINHRFRESVEEFVQLAWCLAKDYMDVPWLVDIAGEEFADIVEPYIDRTKLSERPPQFKLVSAYGATPEIRGQEILNMLTVSDIYGTPLLTAAEAKKLYPDQTLFTATIDPNTAKERRARTRIAKIRALVSKHRRETGFDEEMLAQQVSQQMQTLPPEWQQPPEMVVQQAVEQVAQQLFQQHMTEMPQMRDDDPQMQVDALTEITQDETEDKIARRIAESVQDLYWQVLDMMAAQQQAAVMPAEEGATQNPKNQPRSLATMKENQSQEDSVEDEVHELTAQAKAIA